MIPDLNRRIGRRLRTLRGTRGLTLDQLARRSGVSRSMISVIERGENNSTAVLLEKLANALDVTLASLFDTPAQHAEPIARAADQAQWRDPSSGYLRRNVSPSNVTTPIRIVEVWFPAGANVTYESGARDTPVYQQVWVLAGAIDVTVGDEQYRLEAGDCLAFDLDQPTSYRNPTSAAAHYVVVVADESGLRR